MVVLPGPLVFPSGGCVVEMQRAKDRHLHEPYDGGLSDLGVSFWNVSQQNVAGLRASSTNSSARTVMGIGDFRTFCRGVFHSNESVQSSISMTCVVITYALMCCQGDRFLGRQLVGEQYLSSLRGNTGRFTVVSEWTIHQETMVSRVTSPYHVSWYQLASYVVGDSVRSFHLMRYSIPRPIVMRRP